MKKQFTNFLILSFIFLFILSPFTTTRASSSWDSNTYFKYQNFVTIGLFPTLANRGDGVVVAVIDDGVWISHPDLNQNIWINSGEIPNNKIDDDGDGYIDDYYGWNFIDNNSNMETKGSHGTSVAGIIAASDNNQGIVGVASRAKIMPLIVCDETGCNRDRIINAIRYATNHGADVINLSLGTQGYLGYQAGYNDIIKFAYDHNVVIVASAGNGDVESLSSKGQNLDIMPASPVSNDVNNINMVLGVGASGAPWSNYGNAVDIVAPGINITSTVVPLYDDGYYYSSFLSGTSFSAPMVAGAVALYKAQYPNKKNWEIIDKFKYQKELKISNIMDNNIAFDMQCTLDSSSLESGSGEISIKGTHIRSDIVFYIQTQDGSSSLNTNTYMTILDANSIKLDASRLATGDYVLITSNDFCRKKSVAFSVKNNYSPVAPSVELNIPKANNSENFLLKEKGLLKIIDKNLSNKLKGKILLQIEDHGEAWYVNPKNSKRYYMANGDEAYKIMRDLGIGINNKDLGKIWADKSFAKKYSGKIFLQIEANGEAYYIDFNGVAHYLKNGDEAYKIMRELGLGIKNNDIRKIEIN